MCFKKNNLETTKQKIEYFLKINKKSKIINKTKKSKGHNCNNKYNARERIENLLDSDSFVEFDRFALHQSHGFNMQKKRYFGDGIISGYGTINKKLVAIYSQDFSIYGGSISEINGKKIIKIQKFALTNACPLISINDGGGARIQEGIKSLSRFAEIFKNNIRASGFIPQISIIMGPSAGGAAYSPALTDYIIMVDKQSYMFITGPKVIKSVTGEDVDMEKLGGAQHHSIATGTAHYLAANEKDALIFVRDILDYLPKNNLIKYQDKQFFENKEKFLKNKNDYWLNSLIPDSSYQAYDMKEIIKNIVDDNYFLEIQSLYARNIIIGYAKVGNLTVGIVANQPMYLAGTLDINASEKAARFVRNCDAFNIPIITLVDVPGFLPGAAQESSGIIRKGAKLLYAYGEASIPMITIITRKAYGGAYIVMGSKSLGSDVNLAWPTAQIGVMGAESAIDFLYKSKFYNCNDLHELNEMKLSYKQNYELNVLNPYKAAEMGYIDSIIEPSNTRINIVKNLYTLRNKTTIMFEKKHGNMPL